MIALYLYAVLIYGSMAMMSVGAVIVFLAFTFRVITDYFAEKRASDNGTDDGLACRSAPASLFKPTLFKPTIVLTIACIFSLVFAALTGLEYYGQKPQINWIDDTRKLWHLFFPFLLFHLLRGMNEKDVLRILKVWLFAGLASAVLGVVQYYLPLYRPMLLPHLTYENYMRGTGFWSHFKGSYHATGLAGFHLSYASILAFPACVWLALTAFFFKRSPRSVRTILFLLGSLVFMLAFIFTYSKMVWLTLPLILLLYAFIALKKRGRIIFVVSILCLIALVPLTHEFKYRFQGVDTIKERMTVWNANLDMIGKHPFFGVGWHHNSELSEAYYRHHGFLDKHQRQERAFVSHAHNNVLDQFSSTGLFGLIAWLWLCLTLLRMAWLAYKNQDLRPVLRMFGLGIFTGFIVLHLHGLSQTNFWDAKVMHQMGFMTAILLMLEQKK